MARDPEATGNLCPAPVVPGMVKLNVGRGTSVHPGWVRGQLLGTSRVKPRAEGLSREGRVADVRSFLFDPRLGSDGSDRWRFT